MNQPTDHGYEPNENATIDKAVELFRAVAAENWAAIQEARNKSAVNKVKFSVAFTVDCGGKLSVSSQKHTADFAEYVDDGEQGKLPFDGEVEP